MRSLVARAQPRVIGRTKFSTHSHSSCNFQETSHFLHFHYPDQLNHNSKPAHQTGIFNAFGLDGFPTAGYTATWVCEHLKQALGADADLVALHGPRHITLRVFHGL